MNGDRVPKLQNHIRNDNSPVTTSLFLCVSTFKEETQQKILIDWVSRLSWRYSGPKLYGPFRGHYKVCPETNWEPVKVFQNWINMFLTASFSFQFGFHVVD